MPQNDHVNPEVAKEVEIKGGIDWQKTLAHITKNTKDDEVHRHKWFARQQQNFRQRYSLEFLEPDIPWPNSSSINIPITDMAINKIKPLYLQYLSQIPLVLMEPQDPAFVEKAARCQAYFEYLMRFQTNDFNMQLITVVDSILQAGYGIGKTYWEHKTIDTVQKITRDDLPDYFTRFMAAADQDASKGKALFDAGFQMAEQPISMKSFKKGILDATRRLVVSVFRLNDKDAVENSSADQIMKVIEAESAVAIVKKRGVIRSGPRMACIHPLNCIFPPWVDDIEAAPRITHKLWMSEEEVVLRARDAAWDDKATDMLLSGSKPSMSAEQILQLTGQDEMNLVSDESVNAGLYEVHETCAYMDLDGDGTPERVVIMHAPTSTEVPLKARPFPYAHGQWPYTIIQSERNIGQTYIGSRGIPEQVRDLAIYSTMLHRGKMNRLMLETAPSFLTRASSLIDPATWRFLPGQAYPVERPDDIVPFQIPPASPMFVQAENIVTSIIEERIGAYEAALSGPNSPHEARSAKEISVIQQSGSQMNSMRLMIFREGLTRMLRQLWGLAQQFETREVMVATATGEMFRATSDEIQGHYDIVLNVPYGLDDPISRQQMEFARIAMLQQLQPLLAQDPRWNLDIGMAAVDFLQRTDYRATKRILRPRTPQEAQQVAMGIAQQRQMQMALASAEIAAKHGAASGGVASGAAKMMTAATQSQQAQQEQQGAEDV